MNIALIGYGKMGKAIEEIAISRGHQIVERFSSQHPFDSITSAGGIDVAIEFTQPKLAPIHIKKALDLAIPIVVGTTAWSEHLAAIKEEVLSKNGALLYASNFSVGVNIFFELNKRLAQLMSNHSEYRASIEEIHHIQKLDAPSGTAVSLATDLLAHHELYSSWQLKNVDSDLENNSILSIDALRLPEVPGTHSVRYSSEIDTITITHEAHSRKGFALGAVIAAEFLHLKKGIFTMSDVLKF